MIALESRPDASESQNAGSCQRSNRACRRIRISRCPPAWKMLAMAETVNASWILPKCSGISSQARAKLPARLTNFPAMVFATPHVNPRATRCPMPMTGDSPGGEIGAVAPAPAGSGAPVVVSGGGVEGVDASMRCGRDCTGGRPQRGLVVCEPAARGTLDLNELVEFRRGRWSQRHSEFRRVLGIGLVHVRAEQRPPDPAHDEPRR